MFSSIAIVAKYINTWDTVHNVKTNIDDSYKTMNFTPFTTPGGQTFC